MKTSCALLTLLMIGLGSATAAAQQSEDQARLAEIAKAAVRRFEATLSQPAQTAPATPAVQIETPGPTVELTLDEATARALDRNLDIAVERLNPQLQDYNIERIRAAYRPTVTSTISTRSQTQPPTSQLNGGLVVSTDQNTYNAGLAQSLPWGGGNLTVNWNNQRSESNNSFSNFNPSLSSSLQASYTQPLLRNFRIDGTRQQLKVTAINRDISDIQLRATLSTTVANVRNAYWDLLYAGQAVEVARSSLELAERLVADNRARVEVGTLAPLDVVQAEAEAATRRGALVQAESTLRTAELILKRLIVNGTSDELWQARITPVDRPEFSTEAIDIESSVMRALSNRTDLERARKTIESNDLTMGYLRNQTLPGLDVVANYTTQGVGGIGYVRQGLGGTATQVIPGGYSDALSALAKLDYPVWQVQLNVTYPIGNSAQDASYARARVQRNQSAAQLRALELQVAAEVTNAALQVQSNLTRYQAAQAARGLAETRLQAEQSRFEVGLSTNFFVVQAQRDLTTAQDSELRALLDYQRALVDFQRVQETGTGGAITVIQ